MEKKEELRQKLEQMKRRRITVSKILLAVSILYFIWIMLVILVIYYFGIGYEWIQKLQISLPSWIVMGSILYVLFIIIELLLYAGYRIKKNELKELEKPKPLYYKGKLLYIYTQPKDAKGGIFSKTIISVDDNTILNLRFQMLKPHDLWLKE